MGELTLTGQLTYAHSSGNMVIENDPVVTATYRYLEQHTSLYEMYNESAGSELYMLPSSFAEYSERRDGGTGILRLKNPLFLNWDGGLPDGWSTGGGGTGVVSKVPLVYSYWSPGFRCGCSPITPAPRTSCCLPSPSVTGIRRKR